MNGFLAFCALTTLTSVALRVTQAPALPIEVVYDDAPGEGFHDPMFGDQRRMAFETAIDHWARALAGTVPIVVAANMVSLGGTGANALLASTGAITVHRNFAGARAQTWYAAALANQLALNDVNGPELAEIGVTFNADVDDSAVLGSVSWYYGLDAQPGVDIDFITIALHEIGHGLGFLDTIDASAGTFRLDDQPSILERMLVRPEIGLLSDLLPPERLAAIVAPHDLLWSGPTVLGFNGSPLAVYSPDPFEQGSSIAHWDTGLGELMQPFYTQANHDMGALLPALIDLGWKISGPTPTPRHAPATPTSTNPPRPSPTPATPAAQRGMVYVTNFDDSTVSVIDATTRAVVDTIAVDNGPLGIAASTDGSRVYLAGFQAGTLSVLRTGDARIVASAPVAESPNGVAVTPDGAFLAVSDTVADQVVIVSADTLRVVARVPSGPQPSGVALDGDGRLAFVANFSGATVSVVDLDARRRRAIIPMPFVTASDGLLGVAIAPATGWGFVTSYYDGWARPLRADTLSTPGLVYPFGLSVVRSDAVVANTAGELAYFAAHDVDTGDGRISVMQMADNRVLAEIPVGKVPEALALGPDEMELYVANTGSNTVSIVDTTERRVVRVVAVGGAPMGVAAVAVPEGQCLDACHTPTPPLSTATATPEATVTSTPSAMCPSDCDASQTVDVNELVVAVAIALGERPLMDCRAADGDRDGTVTVAELVNGVDRLLTTCS